MGRCSAERREVDGELKNLRKRLVAAEKEQQGAVGTSQSCQQSLAGERPAAMADLPPMYIAATPVLYVACAQLADRASTLRITSSSTR